RERAARAGRRPVRRVAGRGPVHAAPGRLGRAVPVRFRPACGSASRAQRTTAAAVRRDPRPRRGGVRRAAPPRPQRGRVSADARAVRGRDREAARARGRRRRGVGGTELTRSRATFVATLAALLAAAPAFAHRLSPAFFGLTETAPDLYAVQWKVSLSG